MHKFVYTKSLDNADDIEVVSLDVETFTLATNLFKERVNRLMLEVLDNNFLSAKISIHKNKALFNIEGVHHCIAIS